MSRWGLETSPQFDKAARKLDPQVLRRVMAYLYDVCELDDPRSRGKGLAGDLAGYWRYRIGDYGVLVEVRDEDLVNTAITLGHLESTEQPELSAAKTDASRTVIRRLRLRGDAR